MLPRVKSSTFAVVVSDLTWLPTFCHNSHGSSPSPSRVYQTDGGGWHCSLQFTIMQSNVSSFHFVALSRLGLLLACWLADDDSLRHMVVSLPYYKDRWMPMYLRVVSISHYVGISYVGQVTVNKI